MIILISFYVHSLLLNPWRPFRVNFRNYRQFPRDIPEEWVCVTAALYACVVKRDYIAYLWPGSLNYLISIQNPTANETCQKRKDPSMNISMYAFLLHVIGLPVLRTLSLTKQRAQKKARKMFSDHMRGFCFCAISICNECLQKQFVSRFNQVTTVNAQKWTVSKLWFPKQAQLSLLIRVIYIMYLCRERGCILYYFTS